MSEKSVCPDYATKSIIIATNELYSKISNYFVQQFKNTDIIYYDANQILLSSKQASLINNIIKICNDNSKNTIFFFTDNSSTTEISLLLKNISNNCYYLPHYSYGEISSPSDMMKSLTQIDLKKPRLNYIEVHVCDHCNLNCKGCEHFSNLERHESFTDYDEYVSDMIQLKKLFSGVERIRLMGGEPLLNKELFKFVKITRDVFPDCDVRVASNGLLVPKITEPLISTMKQTHTGFDITVYPPTKKIIDTITSLLEKYSINYSYGREVNTFFKKITLTPVNNCRESYYYCELTKYHLLRKGTLGLCPLAGLAHKFNERYDTNIPSDDTNDIYQIDNGWDLYYKINQPINLCKYCCTPHIQEFDWKRTSQNDVRITDSVVEISEIKLIHKLSIGVQYAILSHINLKRIRMVNEDIRQISKKITNICNISKISKISKNNEK